MELYPQRFYLELHRTSREGDETHLHGAVKLAAQLQCPVVATNDVRFLDASEFEAHEARVCIGEGRTLDDPRRARSYSDQQYLRSPREMAELFSDIPEALANTVQSHLRSQMPQWREDYEGVEDMSVAVMGCIVNGPGESKHANIGISLPGTGEQPAAPVYIDGEKSVTLRGEHIGQEFRVIIDEYVASHYPRRDHAG